MSSLEDGSSLAQFVNTLQHGDPAARAEVAMSLCRLGETARPAAVVLVAAVDDDDESVREHIAAALEELGPPDAGSVHELAALLAAESSDIAYWAATLIGRLGADGSPAVESLVAALASGRSDAAADRMIWALEKIGPNAQAALPVLEKLSNTSTGRRAGLASRALEAIRGE